MLSSVSMCLFFLSSVFLFHLSLFYLYSLVAFFLGFFFFSEPFAIAFVLPFHVAPPLIPQRDRPLGLSVITSKRHVVGRARHCLVEQGNKARDRVPIRLDPSEIQLTKELAPRPAMRLQWIIERRIRYIDIQVCVCVCTCVCGSSCSIESDQRQACEYDRSTRTERWVWVNEGIEDPNQLIFVRPIAAASSCHWLWTVARGREDVPAKLDPLSQGTRV